MSFSAGNHCKRGSDVVTGLETVLDVVGGQEVVPTGGLLTGGLEMVLTGGLEMVLIGGLLHCRAVYHC